MPVTVSDHAAPGTAYRRRPDRRADGCEADRDGDLVELIDRGDTASAMHCLMKRHGTAVYRYCREALRDTALADDVHQQVFIEAFRDLPRFGRRSSIRVWLFAIARHRVLDAVRKRRHTHGCLEDTASAEAPDHRPSPAESLDDARLREALVASIVELPVDARTAVLLRYQQNFTFAEMAEICGEQPSTLCARVARALPVLRRAIEARLGSAL